MTRDEAMRRAVEAAQSEYLGIWHGATSMEITEAMITAYERAMADAGWRMVRVPDASLIGGWGEFRNGYDEGWNACRAKMLEDEG